MADFIRITSKDNPLIKLVCALQSSSKERKKHRLFVLEGLRICTDAMDNSIGFDKLIVSDTALAKYPRDIDAFSRNAQECCCVPDSLFKKLGDTESPQGIIALAAFPDNDLSPVPSGRYIALENIQDPSNLGAVSRTAEALGVSGIVLSGGCDPYSPKVLRASMGTLLRLPLFFTDSVTNFAKRYSLRTLACVVDKGAVALNEVKFCDGDMLLIGNEANGLSEETKQSSDVRITIPMSGRAESLNAAAAAAIAMWEMVKRDV